MRPPHTAASLMRYVCRIEGVALQNCVLYQSLSEMVVLNNSTHISLRETAGPGASDIDPVVLVVDKRSAERRSQVTSPVESQELFERVYEQRYGAALQLYYVLFESRPHEFSVYYRVYDDDGEIVPKTFYDENNPSLGRVNTLSVPPPYTVSSLKNCVIKSEGVSGNTVQLFEDEDSESAMNDDDALTLLSDTFPGFIEDRPIAITYKSATKDGED